MDREPDDLAELLSGDFRPRLDEKGRLALPAKFRPRLANGLVMTRGQEGCVFLLPQEEFRSRFDTIRQAPLTNRQARDFMRVFLSGASVEYPDKQGRVQIPAMLRDYAGLGRDVAVIGLGNRVEVWNVETWQSYLDEKAQAFAEMSDDLFPDVYF